MCWPMGKVVNFGYKSIADIGQLNWQYVFVSLNFHQYFFDKLSVSLMAIHFSL